MKMLGDHYEEESDDVPIIDLIVEYRCKRCGEVEKVSAIPFKGFRAEYAMVVESFANDDKENPYYPHGFKKIKSHYCKDGGVGVSKFIGIKEKKK